MANKENWKEVTKQVKDAEKVAKQFSSAIGGAESMTQSLYRSLHKIKRLGTDNSKIYKEHIDLAEEIVKNVKDIGTEEFKTFDVTKKIITAKQKGDKTLVSQLKHLKSINQQHKQQHKTIQNMVAIAKKPFEAIDSFVRQIPVVGDLLADVADFGGMGDNFANGMVEGFTSGFVENANLAGKVGDFLTHGMRGAFGQLLSEKQILAGFGGKAAKEHLEKTGEIVKTGIVDNFMAASIQVKGMTVGLVAVAALAAKATASMFAFARDTGLSLHQTIAMGGALAFNADAVRSFAQELGTVNNLTTMQALMLQIQEKRYGLSAESAAKLFAVERSISGASMDTFLASTKTTAELAKQAGVAPKEIFDDMAQNAELIARFSGESTESLRAAAIQAKSMGLSLDATGKIAESLLNFEESIGNQMEASMLLGKTINMDKARELMFAGNMKGMQDEVINQLRTIGSFNKLNIVQKDALAKLTALEVNQLAKMADPTEAAAAAAEKQKAQLLGAMAAGAAVGATLLGVWMAIRAVTTLGGSLLVDALLAAKGAALGVTVGAGLGAAGGGIYAATVNALGGDVPQLAMGGDIKQTGAAVVHEGESVGNLAKVEKRLNDLLSESKLLRERNDFNFNRLNNKIGQMNLA